MSTCRTLNLYYGYTYATEKNANIPKNNHEYWKNKLEGNVKRDKKNYVKLESMGIKVTVVWECEIKQMSKDKISLEDHIVNILCEITNHI